MITAPTNLLRVRSLSRVVFSSSNSAARPRSFPSCASSAAAVFERPACFASPLSGLHDHGAESEGGRGRPGRGAGMRVPALAPFSDRRRRAFGETLSTRRCADGGLRRARGRNDFGGAVRTRRPPRDQDDRRDDYPVGQKRIAFPSLHVERPQFPRRRRPWVRPLSCRLPVAAVHRGTIVRTPLREQNLAWSAPLSPPGWLKPRR